MLPPDSLQPIQGSLPCAKLDAQPPLQLLATLSRLAILPITEPGAYDGVDVADDEVRAGDAVRRDETPVLVVCSVRCGFAAGAATVTGGSVAAEPVTSVGDPILKSNLTRRTDFALFMVEALTNDELIHEAPAIVGCKAPSALAAAA